MLVLRMLGMRLPSTLAVAWHTREEKTDYLSSWVRLC
jgi:hypothetical protein